MAKAKKHTRTKTKELTRDEKYELFKRQVLWNGWDEIARRKFDELFPEIDDTPGIGELLGVGRDDT